MDEHTFVDLFSGAGGLSVGLEDAGWKCMLAVDCWHDAVETYRRNLPRHRVIEGDLKTLSGADLVRHLDAPPRWIVGGPPCQGWSTIGKRRWDDDRNDMFTEFTRVVRELQPRNFLIENVLGLKDMGAEGDVQELFSWARGLRYHVSFAILRAADYGVPQLRRRVIFVGSRDGLEWQPPRPCRTEKTFASVWDAIGDLPEVGPGEECTEYDKAPLTDFQRTMREGSAGLQGHVVSAHPPHLVRAISFIPDGGNRFAIPDDFQPKSGFHNSYSRLASWAPAVAVTSNLGKPSATRCIHPFQHRGLTAREGARLQTFPDRFHFSGGVVSQRLQVANAVPPTLAAAIGRSLIDERSWVEPFVGRLPIAA